MTEIQVAIFAGGLLFLRLISTTFVVYVITEQLRLWRKAKQRGVVERAKLFRALLFGLAVVLLIKNIIPIFIDLAAITFIGDTVLSLNDAGESLVLSYFTSNAILDLVSSAVIWRMYREARNYR